MKRVKKDRVIMLCAILIAIIAITTLIIINPFKKDEPDIIQETKVITLPNTTYSEMEVTDVEMEYLKENNETMVTMVINNITPEVVEESDFDAIWLNEAGQIIGKIETSVDTLQPGQQSSISVILKGDLRTTATIKLQEKEK